jgi:hypothetical protein
MALKQPRRFAGQVRGVSHHGQEILLHPQAEYIYADFSSSKTFPCIHAADHTFEQLRFLEKGYPRMFLEAEEMNAVDGALLRERRSRFLRNDSQNGEGKGNGEGYSKGKSDGNCNRNSNSNSKAKAEYRGLSATPNDGTVWLRSR